MQRDRCVYYCCGEGCEVELDPGFGAHPLSAWLPKEAGTVRRVVLPEESAGFHTNRNHAGSLVHGV